MLPSRSRTLLLSLALIAGVSVAYSNHFGNSFHFDDSHAVVDNPYIRDLRNTSLFFTDARVFSNLPANRSWRPLVSLSLAIDYWLGHGLKPVFFQASTFLWFVAQLVLMQALFRRICDMASPNSDNQWTAWFAAALYGLHPANAETVNYVIQRGDVFSTLGVVAGIAIYAFAPAWRRYGIYLLPVVAALLSKPPALVFPALLFVFIRLFEEPKTVVALRKCAPALVVAGIMAFLNSAMTPATFATGAGEAMAYRITQPLVALRYFRTFFIPNHLSADSDHEAVSSIFAGYAWVGFLFVAAVVACAWWCSKRREWKPAAFGLWWFLLALLPTALFPLAEVENDHRMYFPFVGLALAVCWPAALWVHRYKPSTPGFKTALASVCVGVLTAAGAAAWERNRVWHTDESLWYDVTVKSPHNGRGLMNYGLTQMAKGDMPRALDAFDRALVLTPNYSTLEVNLGIANGVLNRVAEAQQHYVRALQLAPNEATPHYFYALWLNRNRRFGEAQAQAQAAVWVNPDHLMARNLLVASAAALGNWDQVRTTASETLRRFPSDAEAARYLSLAATVAARPTGHATDSAAVKSVARPNADDYLNLSANLHRAGKYPEAIAAAKETLRLKPDYAEAYNNIAAAYEAMKEWDPAIQAARQALRLKPDFQLARNNLLWSEEQRRR